MRGKGRSQRGGRPEGDGVRSGRAGSRVSCDVGGVCFLSAPSDPMSVISEPPG